ncbi:hypothetical protein WDZ11_00215 (plasmid) [Roseomonas mucosa]|uniref:hypothetical protein n=1 Tax=Roseomonas mucosa TaxID=207340 RepID=UPI0030D302CE
MSSKTAPDNGRDRDTAAAATKRVRTPMTDALWGASYGVTYTAKSLKAAATRKARKEKAKTRRSAPTGNELAMADLRRARILSRDALIDIRIERGFRWEGGAVVPGSDYHRPAFTFRGLVSDQHPLLQMFVAKLRRAKNLRIGDDKTQSYTSDSKLLALDAPYVEGNKAVCGILRVEVDAVVTVADIRAACAASGAREPNLVVGWLDAQGRYHRPHLLWLLEKSVPLDPKAPGKVARGTKKPTRFRSLFRGVVRGLVNAMLPLGADPGGILNCHRHKNAVSPLWDRAVLAEQPYDLAELAETVDTRMRMKALHERAAELRGATQPVSDHPDPAVAAASNALFRQLAAWARVEVARVRAAGGEELEFASLVTQEACRAAAATTGDTRKSETVALATAAQVAWWTWHVYQPAAPRVELSAEQVVQRRQEGGRIAAGRRRAKTEDVLVAAAVRLHQMGVKVTQAAVLAAAKDEGVRGEKTIRRHWALVTAALAEAGPVIRPAAVKKGASIGNESEKATETCPAEAGHTTPAASPIALAPAFLSAGLPQPEALAFLCDPISPAAPAPEPEGDVPW